VVIHLITLTRQTYYGDNIMNKTLLAICALMLLAGCTASQFSLYTPENTGTKWNITATRPPLSDKITIAVNDSVVVEKAPGLFTYSFEARGMYQGHIVRVYAVHSEGFLGIGEGWETSVFVDNEMAARFRL
jgi:hypothetical protein